MGSKTSGVSNYLFWVPVTCLELTIPLFDQGSLPIPRKQILTLQFIAITAGKESALAARRYTLAVLPPASKPGVQRK